MNDPIPSPQEFFVKLGLYSKVNFGGDKDRSINSQDKYKISNLSYCGSTIDCLCIDCKENSIFTPFLDSQAESNYHLSQFGRREPEVKTGFFEQKFYCSRDKKHIIYISTFVSTTYLVKIGQYPSIADLAENEIQEFRKILGEHYQEFNKAIGLFAHGIGIGSYVYLRRILENLVVKPAYEQAKTNSEWDEKIYLGSRFKEKLNLIKPYLPPFLVNNPNLYSIISKGLHDMSEEDCKTYFPVVKESIMFVLTELKTQKLHKDREQELSNAINKISEKVSK